MDSIKREQDALREGLQYFHEPIQFIREGVVGLVNSWTSKLNFFLVTGFKLTIHCNVQSMKEMSRSAGSSSGSFASPWMRLTSRG